jgi:hypothetical protein
VQPRPVDEWCGYGQVLRWSVYADFLRAPMVEDQLLYSHGTCYHPDPVKLPVGGRYALVVYGQPPQWNHGTYGPVLVPLAR